MKNFVTNVQRFPGQAASSHVHNDESPLDLPSLFGEPPSFLGEMGDYRSMEEMLLEELGVGPSDPEAGEGLDLTDVWDAEFAEGTAGHDDGDNLDLLDMWGGL